MKKSKYQEDPVLLSGNSKTAETVAVCLLLANHRVVMLSEHVAETLESISRHANDIKLHRGINLPFEHLTVIGKPVPGSYYSLAVAVTSEILPVKSRVIELFETLVSGDTPIAVNTESFGLEEMQEGAVNPNRIIGLNWVEPAHTTIFLEVICTGNTDTNLVQGLVSLAKDQWGKDPYVVKTGSGIRAKLISALIREAFFLVENEYVTPEDIDRACRNDAGYYLPFAGNFRYMDLMGTYLYGLVMKDMNPDLSTQKHVPDFFSDRVNRGFTGMESDRGMYEYKDGEVEKWNEVSRNFTYQIRKIMEQYREVV